MSGAVTEVREDGIVCAFAPLMGGRVGVYVRSSVLDRFDRSAAEHDARLVLGRIGAWARRLTRFDSTSDLVRLNHSSGAAVLLWPTLARVVEWAGAAHSLTGGVVDPTLIDERLAAEGPTALAVEADGEPMSTPRLEGGSGSESRRWAIERKARGGVLHRHPGLRFDLDGVAKGWLADRALRLLSEHPAAVVDADGDIAVRLSPGERWPLGIADPRQSDMDLIVLELGAEDDESDTGFGVATSGTSVHGWVRDGIYRHHLIDPRTGESAQTDVVQATVVARTAREAEAFAKMAVILGSSAGTRALDRPGVLGAVLLTKRDELLLLPSTVKWLA